MKTELIITVGATAGKALYGSGSRVTRECSTVLDPRTALTPTKSWPRSTLRPCCVSNENREEIYAGLVCELRVATAALG
ncbi:hypothetical protein [Streptomyces halobius]|uniref:Uncharacterized protein n=1 Tax=Streptomyces halobius TaxID=2879846 RepID=A0ABY4ML16_9ACTN|nr:hypothetical protein [Streptomyces halobius]UQA97120.1 hypothetical protein K9S39_39335 [Streptomyces halobius]